MKITYVNGTRAGNVAVSTISLCATLMQDFKTGYLTLATPKAMFGSQLVATLVGIFLSTLSFQVPSSGFGSSKKPLGHLVNIAVLYEYYT